MGLDYEAIDRRIKAARMKQDMTQEELSEHVQVSTAHISKIETAYTKPSFQVVVDIANALQISIDELLADNYIYPSVYLHKDFKPLLENMTADELRIMRDTMKTLQQFLIALSHQILKLRVPDDLTKQPVVDAPTFKDFNRLIIQMKLCQIGIDLFPIIRQSQQII